jgi:Mg-chelatase subunit ChlD
MNGFLFNFGYKEKYMKMMNFILMGILILAFNFNGLATKMPINPLERTVKILNMYVDHANTLTSKLHTMRQKLLQVNRLADNLNNGSIITFTYSYNPSEMLDLMKSLDKSFEEIRQEASFLTPAYQDKLNKCIYKYRAEFDKLAVVYNKTCTMLKCCTRKDNAELNSVYDGLYQSQALFINMRTARDSFYNSVKFIFQKHRITLPNKELNNIYTLLELWHNRSDKFYAMGSDSTSSRDQLEAYVSSQQELAFKIKKTILNKSGILSTPQFKSVIPLVDSIILLGDSYIENAETFLKTFSSSNFDTKCQKPKRVTNRNYADKASEKASQFSDAVNNFFDKTGDTYLAFVKVPPLYEVLDSRKFVYKSPANTTALPMVGLALPNKKINPETTPATPKKDNTPVTPENFKEVLSKSKPNNLILLLDISGSMLQANKLPLLKSKLEKILPQMREEDMVSVIVYSDNAKVALKLTSAKNMDDILNSIVQLGHGVTTNINDGIKLAYKEAHRHFTPEKNNQIILCTDGLFDLQESTLRIIEKKANIRNISLSIFYIDQVEQKSVKRGLEKAAELGLGSYYYVGQQNLLQKMIERITSERI